MVDLQSGLNMTANDCFWPIVLNKLIIQNCVTIDHRERHFCTLLHGIRVWKPLPKLKISISDAYFSAVETMADFFNGIGRCLPVSMGCISILMSYRRSAVTAAVTPCAARTRSAARSAMTTHGAIVLPTVIRGMIEASAMRSLSTPYTRS